MSQIMNKPTSKFFLTLEVLIRTTLMAVSIMDEKQGVENEHKGAYTST